MPALKTQWFSRPGQRDVLQAVALRYGPWLGALLLSLAGLWLWHSRRLHAEVRRTRAAQALAEASGAATRRFTTFLAREGGGTVARLRFPAHRAESAPARPPQSLRVLVVEDAEVYGLLALLQGHLLLEKTDDVRALVERALRVLDAAPAPAPV